MLACATAAGIKTPGLNMLYAGPSQKDTLEIVRPDFDDLVATCPKRIRPVLNESTGTIHYPTGSRLNLLGTGKKQKNSGRGRLIHYFFFDECGFAEDPDYVINTVVMPSLIEADGYAILSSTIPVTPSHPFVRRVREAEARHTLYSLSAKENPDVTPELYHEWAREAGGETTTMFRREYGCEIITEEKYAVIPEAGRIQVAPADPAASIGGYGASINLDGLTVAVSGYASGNKVYITGEYSGFKLSPTDFARTFEAVPGVIYSHAKPELMETLRLQQRLRLVETSDDLPSGLSRLRTSIQQGTLVIDPRCEMTLRHLRDAVWNEARTAWQSSGDGGKFDAVWAVINFLRFGPEVAKIQFTGAELAGPGWEYVFGKKRSRPPKRRDFYV